MNTNCLKPKNNEDNFSKSRDMSATVTPAIYVRNLPNLYVHTMTKYTGDFNWCSSFNVQELT